MTSLTRVAAWRRRRVLDAVRPRLVLGENISETGAGVTALFGPSGSGKSVTLAAIAGRLRPTSLVLLDEPFSALDGLDFHRLLPDP